MAKWKVRSGAARVVGGGGARGGSGCAARTSGLRLAVREAGRAVGHVRRSRSAAPEARPLSDYMPEDSRAAVEGGARRTACCRRSSRPTRRWRRRCSCSRCTRAPRTIGWSAAAYRKAGVLDYAYRHFQRAAVLEPCDAVSYDGMARLWRDWGMPDLALSEAHRALHCNAKSAEIYNTLGTILEALGQPARRRARLPQRRGAQPARDVRAQQPVLCRDGLQGNAAAAARFCERGARQSTRISPPPATTSRSSRRSAATSPRAEQRLRAGSPSGIVALQRRRVARSARRATRKRPPRSTRPPRPSRR